MARQRLGVVLLVPQPLATRIDGIRAALGDGALGRIAPHITLVPPVNVAERDLGGAFTLVRQAAARTDPLALRLGPVATFHPVNPVAYLEVDGALEALGSLRTACLSGPLERSTEHEFVPHVTVADDLSAARIEGAVSALADLSEEVTFDRVHVLAEQPGRIWRPIADAPLGSPAGVVGRGSLPLDIAVTGQLDAEGAALLAIESDPNGLPFAITARREGSVIAAAWGWTIGSRLEVADLAVAAAHRGQGVGHHLIAAIEGLAGRRSCTAAGISAPSTGAAAALLSGCGWQLLPAPTASPDEQRRWERRLPTTDDGS